MSDDVLPRLEALERAVTDGETDLTGVEDAAALDARLTTLETTVDEVAARLDHLDATTQAMRGYLSGIDGVSDDVERRADLALAKAEALERTLGDDDGLVVERLDRTVPDAETAAQDDALTRGQSHETGAELSTGGADATSVDSDPSNGVSPRFAPVSEPTPTRDERSLTARLRDVL